MARTSLQPDKANFDAQYAASCTIPSRPPMLATFTMMPLSRSSIRGRIAIVMRAGAKKLMRMTRSTSSYVRSWMRRRFGMAALCTMTSRWPNASHASSATRSARSRSSRSATHSRLAAPAPADRQSASTSARRSSRRATMPTVSPSCAIRLASAAPIPDDAPVMRTFTLCLLG